MSPEQSRKALDLVTSFNASQIDGFWIHPQTKDFFNINLDGVPGNSQDSCLVLLKSQAKTTVPQFRWESCFSTTKGN